MATAPQTTTPARDWRPVLALGLTIGIALPVARAVASALEPSLGYWGALALSLVAAGATGGIVALLICWLFKPSGSSLAAYSNASPVLRGGGDGHTASLPGRPAQGPTQMGTQREPTSPTPDWGTIGRALFRFAFAYLVLYTVFGGNFAPLWKDLWGPVVLWVGKHVFEVDITALHVTGSGDTTWNYVQVFCFLVLAATAAVVWALLDRKRYHYARLHDWLRVIVRFLLFKEMVVYGAAKVVPLQFSSPSLDQLLQPLGDSSPMGLLWKFMGASASYVIFTGVAEMLGGLLLTARRTTLLGALVCIGVLSNVVMLNFCYDVPVKLLSSHLLAMAVFLILPDLRRLADLFLLNRGVGPVEARPLFGRKGLNRGALVLRTVLVVGFTAGMLLVSCLFKAYEHLAPESPLYGIWNVEELEVDGEVRPPLVTDAARWRRVIFDNPRPTFTSDGLGYAPQIDIQLMSDARQHYDLQLSSDTNTLALTKPQDPTWQSAISYKEPEPGLLVLEGTFDGRKIRARLRRADEPPFLLTSRGFHWINEAPFNR